ncbi:MAG: ScpA family protein [Pseudomonadota bacterium]
MSPFETVDGDDDARPTDEPSFTVDIDGFEGPLDMLLSLARAQKVDLRRISVLQLAEQYLAFVASARNRRIELAADYLVMAAWLAYLKSRLLLPPEETDEEPSGEDLAARLALRLERLDAMRRVAAKLMARDRLGQEVFSRGAPETVQIERALTWTAGLGDLLKAYARIGTKEIDRPLRFDRPPIWGVEAALTRLREALGACPDWRALAEHLPPDWLTDVQRCRSAVAGGFVATLELARRGELELRQEGIFAPLMIRAADPQTRKDAA